MTTVKFAIHNQADRAASPASGWDVECLTERSDHPAPKWAERFRVKSLKGLAIDWDPDVLDVRKKHWRLAHPGAAKFSPNRGTIWVEGSLVAAPYIDVAVVCSHRLNDPAGKRRVFGPVRRLIWRMHSAQDRRIFTRLERRGYLVLYGGDINDRRAGLDPLVRELRGHYDAIGHSRGDRVRLVSIEGDRTTASDHARYTATFNIKEK